MSVPKGQAQPLPDGLPDFFILGGPKCGTTSLFDWLRQHPDTYLPAKEPNFLSRDIYDVRGVPGALKDWDEYLSALMPADHAGKVTGESTPRSLYSAQALQVLSSHPSQPKLIAVLRNPVDLVFSLHGQFLREGVEHEPDFETAWRRALKLHGDPEAWRTQDGRIDRRLDYPLFGKLGWHLRMWREAVPDERLMVLILEEELSKAPHMAVSDVLSFLGLAPFKIDTKRSNERYEHRLPGLNRTLRRVRTGTLGLMERAGIDVAPARGRRKGTGLMKLVETLNKRPDAKPTARLSPVLRRELADYFADDVNIVAKQLDSGLPWADWPEYLDARVTANT
ncbi:sulfotransferase domain-containing protein [Palleronia abyssalis]|uniref:Sulfotransferase domain-containing protein n=1 Tax=Palleronia abyssalis TaxID=1501240 RepID=A0A2R8BST9_9RHOB|nr:sulfotransferase domain-containing protein [Palleronia abyssalis]SPJ23213.1 hypothetical protein PAA8504_01019 [Palleronia abyssalis]